MILHFFIVFVSFPYISLVHSFSESSKLTTEKKNSPTKLIAGRSSGNLENCYLKGDVHQHGSNINRSDDPCERCFCYKGTILCWSINCPQFSDRKGCREVQVKNLCCPILECPLASKDTVIADITGRQAKVLSQEISSISPQEQPTTPKEVTCKYGRERYKPGERVTINPLKPCQRCSCSNEGKVKCELALTCKDELSKTKNQSNGVVNTSSGQKSVDPEKNKETENQVSSFSTRTIPDAILKRVQNLLHTVSTQNLTSVNPSDLN